MTKFGSKEFWAATASGAISGGICGFVGPLAGTLSFTAGAILSFAAGSTAGFLADMTGQLIVNDGKFNPEQSLQAGLATGFTNVVCFSASRALFGQSEFLTEQQINNKSVTCLKTETGQMYGDKASLVRTYIKQQNQEFWGELWFDEPLNGGYGWVQMDLLDKSGKPSYNKYWKFLTYVYQKNGGYVVPPFVNKANDNITIPKFAY